MTGQGGRQVPPAESNHAAFDHEQLKKWTDDADTGTSQAFADEWTRTGTVLMDAADSLKRASMGTEAGWTGDAAEAMRQRLGLIAGWSGGTGSQISAAGQTIARQSEAADAARRAMPEPVSYKPADIIRDAPGNGLMALVQLPELMYQRYQESNAAHEEAVRVVAERDQTMSTAAGEVSVFQAPPSLDGSDDAGYIDSGDGSDGAPGSDGPEPGGPRSGEPGGFGGGPGSGGDSGAPRTSAPPGGGPPGGGPPVGGSGSPGITTPDSFAPREPAPVGGGPTGFGSSQPPGVPPGFGPMGGGPGGFGGGAGGSGGGSGGGVRGGSPGGGAGAGQPGAGPGGRGLPGVAPGPAAAKAAAMRGAAAGRGGAPMSGMPMGGAGRRDEDAEHQRPEFLQEPDPDGIFDTDVLTAPPVIGAPDDE
ncbi:MAG: hypothetical protein GEV28_17185 [Actinophytocola sp.]|uniref:hypothetical protein n=1 Tax=Actinophytocola sp. TaxID=1872138 RepID=UPI00132B08AD|nr:hypothetical protein [Actinophytocola sp.]MPZ82025.1 hypothetical protein [Actinophytocola sp.]